MTLRRVRPRVRPSFAQANPAFSPLPTPIIFDKEMAQIRTPLLRFSLRACHAAFAGLFVKISESTRSTERFPAHPARVSQLTHSCSLENFAVGRPPRHPKVVMETSPLHMDTSRRYSKQWSCSCKFVDQVVLLGEFDIPMCTCSLSISASVKFG